MHPRGFTVKIAPASRILMHDVINFLDKSCELYVATYR